MTTDIVRIPMMACLTVQSSLVSHAAGSALEHVRFVDEIFQRCRRPAPRRQILLLITAAYAKLLSDDMVSNFEASLALQLLTHPQWCCRSEQDFVQRRLDGCGLRLWRIHGEWCDRFRRSIRPAHTSYPLHQTTLVSMNASPP